jgi:hypothetical protein
MIRFRVDRLKGLGLTYGLEALPPVKTPRAQDSATNHNRCEYTVGSRWRRSAYTARVGG